MEPCRGCNGRGWWTVEAEDGGGEMEGCPACEGTGESPCLATDDCNCVECQYEQDMQELHEQMTFDALHEEGLA